MTSDVLKSYFKCKNVNVRVWTMVWTMFSGVGKPYSGLGKRLFQHFSWPNSYSNELFMPKISQMSNSCTGQLPSLAHWCGRPWFELTMIQTGFTIVFSSLHDVLFVWSRIRKYANGNEVEDVLVCTAFALLFKYSVDCCFSVSFTIGHDQHLSIKSITDGCLLLMVLHCHLFSEFSIILSCQIKTCCVC